MANSINIRLRVTGGHGVLLWVGGAEEDPSPDYLLLGVDRGYLQVKINYFTFIPLPPPHPKYPTLSVGGAEEGPSPDYLLLGDRGYLKSGCENVRVVHFHLMELMRPKPRMLLFKTFMFIPIREGVKIELGGHDPYPKGGGGGQPPLPIKKVDFLSDKM